MNEEKAPDIVIETSNPEDQNPAEKSEKELNTEDWKTVVDEAYLDYALKKASELRAKRRKREEEEIITFVTGKVREGVPVDEAISVTLEKIKKDSAELEEIILVFLERVWMCVEDAKKASQKLYEERVDMDKQIYAFIKKLRDMEELPESLKNEALIMTLEKLFNTTIDPSSLLTFLSSTSEQNASEFVNSLKRIAPTFHRDEKNERVPVRKCDFEYPKGIIRFLEAAVSIIDCHMNRSIRDSKCIYFEAKGRIKILKENVLEDNEEACTALCNKVIGMKEKLESECDGIYEPPTKVLKEGPKDERVGELLVEMGMLETVF